MFKTNIKKTILFSNYKAEFFLLFATLLWGGTFPVIKYGLQWLHPILIILFRFLIAFLILNIYLILAKKIQFNIVIIKYSFSLAFTGFFAYFLQTIGLQYTTPPRSAFITQTLIIFVYVFQFFLLKKEISFPQWISLVLIMIGSYFLFFHSSTNLYFFSLKGDILTLFSAICFAMYIILIDKFPEEFFIHIINFHFLFIFLFSFLGIMMIPTDFPSISSLFTFPFLLPILYLSIPATLITTIIMFYFQPKTTPAKASILYAMEPVFALILSVIFLNSTFTYKELLGCSFIFIGSFIDKILLYRLSLKRNLNI